MAEIQNRSHNWPWPDSLDAVKAAPNSHEILLENEHVRVLKVVVAPGKKEPLHTHRWPSVMLIKQRAGIRYYGEKDELVFESPQELKTSENPTIEWMAPEGLHAVENIDDKPYRAIRIEIKQE